MSVPTAAVKLRHLITGEERAASSQVLATAPLLTSRPPKKTARELKQHFETSEQEQRVFPGIHEVDVDDLRFTQETAGYNFSQGPDWKPEYSKDMHELFQALLRGDTTPAQITDPKRGGRPLQVLVGGRQEGGKRRRLYSCDNRRLCVLKSFAQQHHEPVKVHVQFVNRCHHKVECKSGTACTQVRVTKTNLEKSPLCPSSEFTEFLYEPSSRYQSISSSATKGHREDKIAKKELEWYMYTPPHSGMPGTPEQLRTTAPGRHTSIAYKEFLPVPPLPVLRRQKSL